MNIETLQLFCYPSENLASHFGFDHARARQACGKPWTYSAPGSSDIFTYATNMHVMIRVPAMPEVPTNRDAPNRPDLLFIVKPGAIYLELKPHSLEKAPCEKCTGSGRLPAQMICPQCEGEGDVPQAIDDDECDECAKCRGDGTIDDPVKKEACYDCYGEGSKYRESVPLDNGDGIMGDYFNPALLDKILTLPGPIMIHIPGNEKAAHFTFAGGEGLIMPVKVDYALCEKRGIKP